MENKVKQKLNGMIKGAQLQEQNMWNSQLFWQ